MPVEEPPAATTSPLMKVAAYCYGVTWAASAKEPSRLGVADAPLELVRFRDLAALTSPIESTRVRDWIWS